MKCFLLLTRSGLAVVCAAVILIFVFSAQVNGVTSVRDNAATNAKRLEFIESLNIKVKEECAGAKKIIVPTHFSDVYRQYNNIQKKAGYDLSQYKGCEVTCYSYELTGGDAAVNLIVYNGSIIGGDIADYSVEGVMLPLEKQE